MPKGRAGKREVNGASKGVSESIACKPPRRTALHIDLPATARRLIRDGNLLCSHKRWESAYLLYVHGIEELGSCLLDYWNNQGRNWQIDRDYTFHVQKQLAIAHLVYAPSLVTALEVSGIDVIANSSSGDGAMGDFWKLAGKQPSLKVTQRVKKRCFEAKKHGAVYRNKNSRHPEEFTQNVTSEDCALVASTALAALKIWNDPEHFWKCAQFAATTYGWEISSPVGSQARMFEMA
jgi:hypothetical protein